MVSEVNNSSPSLISALEQRGLKLEKVGSAGAAPSVAPASGNPDTLKLTDLGSKLRELGAAVENQPVVDRCSPTSSKPPRRPILRGASATTSPRPNRPTGPTSSKPSRAAPRPTVPTGRPCNWGSARWMASSTS